MTINLITFASLLHKQASALNSHEVILNELEKYFTVRFVNYEDIDKLSQQNITMNVPDKLESQPILEKIMQTRVRNLLAQPGVPAERPAEAPAAAPAPESAPQGE